MNANELAKSCEMPEPEVINYSQVYRMSDLFINDLRKVLADVPYVEAQKFFKKIDDCKRIMPISALNELIRDLSYQPYKVVNGIMTVIQNKDNFIKYFIPMEVKNVDKKKEECSTDKKEEK